MIKQQDVNQTLEQLTGVRGGGFGAMNRLKLMINARDFEIDENGSLSFKFSMCPTANKVKIELTWEDLYRLTFYKGKKVVQVIDGVFNDNLREVFERETGLYVTM